MKHFSNLLTWANFKLRDQICSIHSVLLVLYCPNSVQQRSWVCIWRRTLRHTWRYIQGSRPKLKHWTVSREPGSGLLIMIMKIWTESLFLAAEGYCLSLKDPYGWLEPHRNTMYSISTLWLAPRTITWVAYKAKRYVWERAVYFFEFTALLQPYYQPAPAAPAPVSLRSDYHDPIFGSEQTSAWALYIEQSKGIYVFGAGLYSFFIVCNRHINSWHSWR